MPMRMMNKGEGKSHVDETEALDEKSNELWLGRTMLNSEICDQQGPAESSNKGIPADFDGIYRDGDENLQPSDGEVGLRRDVIDPVSCDGRVNGGVLVQVEKNCGNLSEQDGVVQEMVIVIDPERNTSSNGIDGGAEVKGSEFQLSNVILDKLKTKMLKVEKPSHVIDMKCGAGIEGSKKDLSDGEMVCRICHLSSEGSLEDGSSPTAAAVPMDLIQLGCGCKNELGIAHSHCAEAWFKLRGNRICEICEETAKNVSGLVDGRSMQEWNERFIVGIGSRSSERGGGCWRGQPFCNLLMACLVIAFVLPWFFRVNWL